MNNQMDQEVERAREDVRRHQRWMSDRERADFADHVETLIEAVRRQERERSYIQGWNEGVRASGGSVLLELVPADRARTSEEAGG